MPGTQQRRTTKTKPTAAPTPTPAAELDALPDETWGDRVHRAYRTARRRHPGITYRAVADAISQIFPVTDATLIRLESYDALPNQQRVRIIAYLALLVYGFNPADFGLTKTSVELDETIEKRARDLLVRTSMWFTGRAA